MNLVYQKLHEYLLEIDYDAGQLQRDIAGLDAGWEKMRKMLRNNRGTTKIMLDHGCRSKIIYPCILGGAQAVALEAFSGKALDLSGELVDIPYADTAIRYVIHEPIAVDIRERIRYEQERIRKMGQDMCNAEKWEMLTCGAGLCSFLRIYSFQMPENCHILAVDLDKRNLDNLRLVFDDVRPTKEGCFLEKHRTTYEIADIVEVCQRAENAKRFKIVNAQGVLSYYRFGGKTKELIHNLLKTMRDDGEILCDLNVFEISLIRCSLCMGWVSSLFPDWSVKSAIKRMQKICNDLGLKMEYRVCSRNPHPTTVLFRLWKA